MTTGNLPSSDWMELLGMVLSQAGAIVLIVGLPVFVAGLFTLSWAPLIGGAILALAGWGGVRANWKLNKQIHKRELKRRRSS